MKFLILTKFSVLSTLCLLKSFTPGIDLPVIDELLVPVSVTDSVRVKIVFQT